MRVTASTVSCAGPRIFGAWSAPNLIGILEGRDPALRHEIVAISAHVDALGIRPVKNAEGKTTPVFGAIPSEVYEQFSEDKEKKSDKVEKVIVRFELTEAEYEAIREIYQAWEKNVKTQELPHADPYLNGMEFLSKAADGLNQCGQRTGRRTRTVSLVLTNIISTVGI